MIGTSLRWLDRPWNPGAAGVLSRELGLHPVAARILTARGLVLPSDVEKHLAARLADLPDPMGMRGMTQAVERVIQAIRTRESIVVYGDYDVDGVTSTTLLVSFLRAVGADATYYVPQRLTEGYGLNPKAVEKLAAAGARLIITVDCGVTALEEVDLATRCGVDVVVVDHHKTPPDLPRAVAMLNPHQPGCAFPAKELCAAGVTFFFVMALRKRLRDDGWFQRHGGAPEPNLRAYLDLVALGTVADVVPLVGANRILVTHGLVELANARRPGVVALKLVAGLEAGAVTAGQVGFRLGPRINAAGRLDDASVAVQLLLTDDVPLARRLAKVLDDANADRQAIERRITVEALAQAASRADAVRGLVLYADGWHPGVVGIVASRVVEKFTRPTVVIGLDGEGGKGSCRSIERFDMYASLTRCASHLVRFGGHHHAAGVTVERRQLPGFIEAFEREALAQLSPEDLVPVVRIDADIAPTEVTMTLADALQRLAPFGAGNPEPVLSSVVDAASPRALPSKSGDGDHLKFKIGATDGIGFGMAASAGLLRSRARLAFQLGVDTWNGSRRAQAKLKAAEPC